MKKETFVQLINHIKKYRDNSVKFGKAIANAYIEAGSIEDFATASAYELPYGKYTDDIVKIIASDFSTEDYKAEYAEDIINWWIWECNFGEIKYVDNTDNLLKPLAEIHFSATEKNDEKTFIIMSADVLYDTIMYDMKTK